MEFTHRSYEKGQTIAAVATPPGVGGIAVIRISGDNALAVADLIFSGPIHSYQSHTAHFGKILDLEGRFIDEGMALVMKNPKSYTGEDTVEIHCHGGTLITSRVLQAALAAGARPALPGEFTQKAFQNGKIDLTRAEAVQALIASKSELSCQAAEKHLEGKLYKLIISFQKRLTKITAILEAWVDFPEEGLEFASKEQLLADLEKLAGEMVALQESFQDGRLLHTHPTLCLLGAPNVGKSSIMNALIGKDRAIVTHIPGTTRDILEDEVQIAGLTFRLLDTAGLRETDEIIEQEGVRRSKKAAREADLILLVFDVTTPGEIPPISHDKKCIVIWNKIDLDHEAIPKLSHPHQVQLSAKEGDGIDGLKEEIHSIIWRDGPPSKEEVILTSERHFHALTHATTALERVTRGLKTELSPEFLVSDMRHSLRELGTIIGLNITEEVLSALFSTFCVGK
ncbi:MAG: tRNA modification GTPase MnmE [Chlamydiae bacterium]|nr:tRNA modification GTPase MnmE [Chlamydiota bacterium]